MNKVFFWSIFMICAICAIAVSMYAVFQRRPDIVLFCGFMAMAALVSVQTLVKMGMEKEVGGTKKRSKKVLLWSAFAVSAILLTTATIDVVITEQRYWVGILCICMITATFLSVLVFLKKGEVRKKNAIGIKVKRKEIFLWSVFIISVICLTVATVDVVITEQRHQVITIYMFMIVSGSLGLRHLLKKEQEKARKERTATQQPQ
ncbi:MAG: hypothetical protein LBI15_11445 [Dysgonamonadaceae bacterium]|jgi:SNF family Na+-dependent transporter|nr:hypothetical protein [Dysgonamonadaceae bacterium]